VEDPEHIREELRRLADEKRAAVEALDTITGQMRDLLRQAQGHPDISMVDAARWAGLSRPGVYKLLKEDSR